jgi:hypothetical protein
VLTPVTRHAAGPLKLLIALAGFAAQSPRDGADTTVWAAGQPRAGGRNGQVFDKRHEIRCRFRIPAEIQKLRAIVEQQLAAARSVGASTVDRAATSAAPTQTVR